MIFPSPWNKTTNEWECPECSCWNDNASIECWYCTEQEKENGS